MGKKSTVGLSLGLSNVIAMLTFGSAYFKFIAKYTTIFINFIADFSFKFGDYISGLLMNGFS